MKKMLSLLFVLVIAALGAGGCSNSSGEIGFLAPKGNVISAKGGEGSVNNGGDGSSYFSISSVEGNQIRIERSGTVDTNFDTSLADQFASPASLNFGASPLEVSSNTTVRVYDMTVGSPATTGEIFLVSAATGTFDTQTLYRWNGTDGETITGLHVHPGVTLTFGLNQNYGGNPGFDAASVLFPNDIRNEGTITTMTLLAGANPVNQTGLLADGTDNDSADLFLVTNGSVINDGRILLHGRNAAGGSAGGNGGHFYGWADLIVLSKGTVDTSGGDGDMGGMAKNAEWHGSYGVWNSGAMTARGGFGRSGAGGTGAWIGLIALQYTAPVYNAGALDVSGGDGTFGGGDAGSLDLSTSQSQTTSGAGGDVVNSGTVSGRGGNATSEGLGGAGANPVHIQANGANVRNSGAVNIKGGNGRGAGSFGGPGGFLSVWTDSVYDPYYNNPSAAGSILFSGSISADGGSGETGGNAGDIQFYQAMPPATGDIALIGYGTIDVTGGKGRAAGGNGGYLEVLVSPGDQFAMAAIRNEADINTAGGQGATDIGGMGGDVYIDANSGTFSNPAESFMVDNSGAITTGGGKGAFAGGNAGYIILYSAQNIRNTSSLTATGGGATDSAGSGGYGSQVDIWAVGDIFNYGTINTSGGYGPALGGDGSWASIWSDYGLTINSGNIYANGGNAGASAGMGGSAYAEGDTIDLMSMSSNPSGPYRTQNTGTLQAKAGSGATPGSTGTVYIDGTLQ